ncbi:fibrobacter succinogenes major paralogous domain-containing protein [Membranihabitans marinus]|uniref:fibrobacter succinogenes major paralogous domain-containing protein n=1 Tax=Membranihabitans marinus TaxID=1227546 RepID=UPI001F3B4AEB|nr:fibrobacter succinogenes major paralogous domain-containing protein [Membranihabitans marinus]
MLQHQIFTLLSTLVFIQIGIAQSTGTVTDSRDGQTYKTISIQNPKTGNTMVWMAQNLNYKTPGSYPYNDNEGNRKTFGLLYTWETANKSCPNGWHLPSDREWAILVSKFGGTDKAGEALKSDKGWNEGGNGSNSSGFNALPAGLRTPNGTYRSQGFFSFWWSSSITDSKDKVWIWDISYGGPDMSIKSKIFRFDSDMLGGLSVRCVKD